MSFLDEVSEFPHYKYRGHLEIIDDVFYGKVLIGASAFIGQRTPGRVKWIGRPTGHDNEAIYRGLLGFTKAGLDALKQKGVV